MGHAGRKSVEADFARRDFDQVFVSRKAPQLAPKECLAGPQVTPEYEATAQIDEQGLRRPSVVLRARKTYPDPHRMGGLVASRIRPHVQVDRCAGDGPSSRDGRAIVGPSAPTAALAQSLKSQARTPQGQSRGGPPNLKGEHAHPERSDRETINEDVHRRVGHHIIVTTVGAEDFPGSPCSLLGLSRRDFSSHVRTLIQATDISARVEEMGAEISRDHRDRELVVVGVLTGAFVFMADLVRALTVPVRCDFLGLSSYGHATRSSGVVSITKDLSSSIEGAHVLVVEDIVDSGLTMAYLLRNLNTRGPASVRVAALLSKPARRQVEVEVDYVGFTIEDLFVVGYGMDGRGLYRNLSSIEVLEP